MNYTLLDFLKLIGSLALFLYGMKMMSEALQKVAGSRLKDILSAMTSNRFLGMLTGIMVTTIIQSSSATTVMVVSFVNAGLISLSESIGIIMGANIGTTVTGWIISLLGFTADISDFALPLIGIGMPFVFSKVNRRHSWGEFIMGVALLFMGLDFLKRSVPNISQSPEMLEFLSGYTDLGYLSILLFLAIGTILTIVIQSSSATMALTFVMCSQGWIPFELAAAMVLGENIGTTVTANIAASVGNISARRAAMAHLVFNLLGVVWMLALFYPFTSLIDSITEKLTGQCPHVNIGSVPIALALFHTVFNLTNAFIFIWFTKLIERIVMCIKPSKQSEEEEFHLRFITTGLLSTSELSLVQARKEICFFAKHTKNMFGFAREIMEDGVSDAKFDTLYERIDKYENISDEVEFEIANYLTKVNQGKLSDQGRRTAKAMLKIIGELESIGDANFNIARLARRSRAHRFKLEPEMRDKVNLMFNMVEESLNIMRENLDSNAFHDSDLERADKCEKQINHYRDQLKAEHFENIKQNKYTYEQGVFFTDIISECERLGDYVINITEALSEASQYHL